jgi:hypothetical protein
MSAEDIARGGRADAERRVHEHWQHR